MLAWRYEPFSDHARLTAMFGGTTRAAVRLRDFALHRSSRGMFAALEAEKGFEVTEVIKLTLSLVAAWFCLSFTAVAPAISRVPTPLLPASLKWIGFSSMPYIFVERSSPNKREAR